MVVIAVASSDLKKVGTIASYGQGTVLVLHLTEPNQGLVLISKLSDVSDLRREQSCRCRGPPICELRSWKPSVSANNRLEVGSRKGRSKLLYISVLILLCTMYPFCNGVASNSLKGTRRERRELLRCLSGGEI